MEFNGFHVDYFWWGNRVIGFSFLAFLVLVIVYALGRFPFRYTKSPTLLAKSISILFSVNAALSAVVFTLGFQLWLSEVRPRLSTLKPGQVYWTDIDGYGSPIWFVVSVGLPIAASLFTIFSHFKSNQCSPPA